jgi:hypothetical protein
MKRITALALFAIAALATSTGAFAQQPGMKANIPFDFTVGNTWLPAGEYTISSPLQSVIAVRNADRTSAATVVSNHSNYEAGKGSKLVFLKYGDRYFLHRVLCSSNSAMNLDITSGKAEKEARLQEAKLHTSQEVLVAAR